MFRPTIRVILPKTLTLTHNRPTRHVVKNASVSIENRVSMHGQLFVSNYFIYNCWHKALTLLFGKVKQDTHVRRPNGFMYFFP